ncbi:hypothetical protein R6Q57_005768 [Mikania cordata]
MDDDSKGDRQHNATTSKKPHRPQYIAPMSMIKFANLAKQHRLIAPKVSKKFPLHSNATNVNQSRPRVTMVELVSSNKGSKRQREIFKKNVTKPSYINVSAKRQLLLANEDDETFNKGRYDEVEKPAFYGINEQQVNS